MKYPIPIIPWAHVRKGYGSNYAYCAGYIGSDEFVFDYLPSALEWSLGKYGADSTSKAIRVCPECIKVLTQAQNVA